MQDYLEKFNKQIANKDERIIIPITGGFIQEFVKDNYDRKLTEQELEELSWLVWEEGIYDLWVWIDAAISKIIEEAKLNKKK